MFKSEETMKKAITAIEQGFGDDRWGVYSYFNAEAADYDPEQQNTVLHRRHEYFGVPESGRSCSVGLMLVAVGVTDSLRDVEDTIHEHYGGGVHMRSIQRANDCLGHLGAIAEIRRQGFKTDE